MTRQARILFLRPRHFGVSNSRTHLKNSPLLCIVPCEDQTTHPTAMRMYTLTRVYFTLIRSFSNTHKNAYFSLEFFKHTQKHQSVLLVQFSLHCHRAQNHSPLLSRPFLKCSLFLCSARTRTVTVWLKLFLETNFTLWFHVKCLYTPFLW